MYRVSNFITTFALCLLAGTSIALVWANFSPESYQDFVELRLIDGFPVGYDNPDAIGAGGRTLTLQYLINTVLMSFFFFLTGKEIWEALIQKQGSLRGPEALVPFGAVLGCMLGPALVYIGLAALDGSSEAGSISGGWAIPAATDVAVAYWVGRMVFGPGHPALRLLMLIAICADIVALLILGFLHQSATLEPLWLLLPLIASVLVFVLFNWLPRQLDRGDQLRARSTWVRKKVSFWPYALAGALSWYGFQEAGLHPALGLLPIIPAIPHADRAFGFFAEAEEYLSDTLNRIAHLLTWPVAGVLMLFGLTHGGAVFAAAGTATWITLAAMVLGKPVGVFAGGMLAARLLGKALPKGVTPLDLAVVGCIAVIGLTVPLLMAGAALPGGQHQEAAKLGIVLSLIAGPLTVLAARRMHLGRWANSGK